MTETARDDPEPPCAAMFSSALRLSTIIGIVSVSGMVI